MFLAARCTDPILPVSVNDVAPETLKEEFYRRFKLGPVDSEPFDLNFSSTRRFHGSRGVEPDLVLEDVDAVPSSPVVLPLVSEVFNTQGPADSTTIALADNDRALSILDVANSGTLEQMKTLEDEKWGSLESECYGSQRDERPSFGGEER